MKTILLVDDDDLLRKMLRLKLESLGYAVLEARNGNEATRHQKAHPADIMITDLVMPDKEGLETIHEFRRAHPALKIIAMSGGGRSSAETYLHFATQLGAVAALQKPFSTDILVAALKKALP